MKRVGIEKSEEFVRARRRNMDREKDTMYTRSLTTESVIIPEDCEVAFCEFIDHSKAQFTLLLLKVYHGLREKR